MNETLSVPPSSARLSRAEWRLLLRRFGNLAGTLLTIAYLTSYVLLMSERGRLHLPAQPLQALWQALGKLAAYFFQHPSVYLVRRAEVPAFSYVAQTLWISAGLLLVSLGIAIVLGTLLGAGAALSRRRAASSLMVVLSVLGVSTPSFLLAMLFWVINIRIHQTFDVKALPSAGFGWDAHLIMPALVLAMRPLAQIAQVTYVSLSDVLRQDFIRTARAKGLSWRLVRNRHALRNILIPVLNTIGTSLRFSLASLPVVEIFFNWPGVGQVLMKAVERGDDALVTDLILALGLFFLLVNLAIEIFFPLIDPRVRQEGGVEEDGEPRGWRAFWSALRTALRDWLHSRRRSQLAPLPRLAGGRLSGDRPDYSAQHRRWYARQFFTNVPLMLGLLLVLGLFFVVLAGPSLTDASPYQIHGIMMVDGQIGSPPYPPGETFPWGTDNVGRDLQSLVLSGTRQTMTLAFFGMLARVTLGALLGALAGWRRNGWLDRLVTGAIGVWAAYPLTLFAMLIIQALGIQQGVWVFVVGLSLVGWGEVAQFVRGQVIAIKPQLYIESARASGARPAQILVRHVAPNLVNPLIVLAVLEMGGVLMLIAELGFLNIFLGGGFRLMVGETGQMVPIMVDFSDVPEWASLIATIRLWWRSYPWMALYPGLAFFLSIMAFNILGDGLRRFLDESQANLSRLFNRYTFAAALALMVGLGFFLRASGPLGAYADEAKTFNVERAMQDIARLSSPEFAGRETGTPGNLAAAQYIAARMEAAGLQPAGDRGGYIQALLYPRPHLVEMPRLDWIVESGAPPTVFEYHVDYREYIGSSVYRWGAAEAPVVGLTFGPPPPDVSGEDPYRIVDTDLYDNIVLVRKEQLNYVPVERVRGILAVTEDPLDMVRHDVFPNLIVARTIYGVPTLLITPRVADLLLAPAGSSLADLDRRAASLGPGEIYHTPDGPTLHAQVIPTNMFESSDENYYNVIGYIPGTGSEVDLDRNVIMITAYFDGVGVAPDGTFYPGANDNASGVAMLLEIARLLRQSPYAPKKTVMFVAWSGGERREGMSVTNIMNAQAGLDLLAVETVIELSGVGAGDGKGIAIGDESSSRLVQLFQDAARRFGTPTTTRGRGPHYGYYIRPAFGGRTATTLSLSWDGSDRLAHTPLDTYESIDPDKLAQVGRAAYLTVLVVSRETDY